MAGAAILHRGSSAGPRALERLLCSCRVVPNDAGEVVTSMLPGDGPLEYSCLGLRAALGGDLDEGQGLGAGPRGRFRASQPLIAWVSHRGK